MFQTKVIEKIKTHILYSITLSGNCDVYEIMWKNMVQPDRPQITIYIRRMHIACCITKAIGTHTEYVILTAFPQQHWLTRTRLSVMFICTLPVLQYLSNRLGTFKTARHSMIRSVHAFNWIGWRVFWGFVVKCDLVNKNTSTVIR
jgi:hypothetical protein